MRRRYLWRASRSIRRARSGFLRTMRRPGASSPLRLRTADPCHQLSKSGGAKVRRRESRAKDRREYVLFIMWLRQRIRLEILQTVRRKFEPGDCAWAQPCEREAGRIRFGSRADRDVRDQHQEIIR